MPTPSHSVQNRVSSAAPVAEAVEMPQTDAFESPAATRLRRETGRLMSLGVTTDIDIETDVLRHGRFAPVTAHVKLADVRRGVAVLL